MRRRSSRPPTAAVRIAMIALVLTSGGPWAQEPTVKAPDPGVPEVYSIEGQFVRVAYNNEGFISLGYRTANQSIGEEWLLLEIGATVREKVPNYVLKREALSLETPDGKTIPLSSNLEYREADLRALDRRADMVRDSVNYFPPGTKRPCRIGFFAETASRNLVSDQVELDHFRACLGRLYFKVPGGIRYGQHWLNVRFEKSLLRVPFRILTAEEEKTFAKSWKDIKKELAESFKKK